LKKDLTKLKLVFIFTHTRAYAHTRIIWETPGVSSYIYPYKTG